MKMKISRSSLFIIIITTLIITMGCSMNNKQINYPITAKTNVVDELHGIKVVDNYRWLEDDKNPKVQEWVALQEKITRSYLDKLPQRQWLIKRFNKLLKYDDESTPRKVLIGERIFFSAIKKDWERWAYYTKQNETVSAEPLLNPNEWGLKTLGFVTPSRDGYYIAFATEEGGNEQSVVKIMEVSSKKILSDSLRGWRQGDIVWLPDNSAFYYSTFPLKGEVPDGEEDYWQSVYFHKLGTLPSEDKKIFSHDKVKEYFHGAGITEDGKYILFYRGLFNKNEVYLKRLNSDESMIPVATGFDAQYHVDVIKDKLIIRTDSDAPKGKVYVADVDKPDKKNWKELIPQTNDNLLYVTGVAGHLYAIYTHNAFTVIKIYTLDGKYIRDLTLPTIGSAYVWGYWSKNDIWVYFTSFTYPGTTFKYDFERNELKLYHRPPIDVDVSDYVAEQVWYKSKDFTNVSMFLIHHKDVVKNGNNIVYLTGYGGFNIPMNPDFSTSYVIWLEAGGMIAIPNLRGGGEYGQEWHKSGMLDKKQNVFDDFITATEWLIENKYTNPRKIAIGGGSNGGLLIGAVTVQRPDLFNAAYCGNPLLDMLRYHKFGYANIWAEEYGNADNPEQFKYLLKYSPYHNVVDGTRYPSILFVGSENDARCYPFHAMKMVAKMQSRLYVGEGEPILLLVHKKSGHGGGTTLSETIQYKTDVWSFLMDNVGLKPPLY
ncbi:MAG: prolyl oligopeptidase family serine peptidase [Planctomycetota bacterium]